MRKYNLQPIAIIVTSPETLSEIPSSSSWVSFKKNMEKETCKHWKKLRKMSLELGLHIIGIWQ